MATRSLTAKVTTDMRKGMVTMLKAPTTDMGEDTATMPRTLERRKNVAIDRLIARVTTLALPACVSCAIMLVACEDAWRTCIGLIFFAIEHVCFCVQA